MPVGASPLVIGTLCTFSRNLAAKKYQGACHIVEVRLDCIAEKENWLEKCRKIQALGWPVLLTVRLREEGGFWTGDDEKRFSILSDALENLAAIDIELRSPLARPLSKLAKKLGKICVVSFHDFKKTPPLKRLEEIEAEASQTGSIAKIAAKVNNQSDVDTLSALLQKKRKRPLCVIGMGDDWKTLRAGFARLGSCLTYGYLDKPAAPGQVPARRLMQFLSDPKSRPLRGL